VNAIVASWEDFTADAP